MIDADRKLAVANRLGWGISRIRDAWVVVDYARGVVQGVGQARPFGSDDDYREAIAEIERLWGAELGTPDGTRLDVLATLVDGYESLRWPIEGEKEAQDEGFATAIQACWVSVLREHDLYLHKKGGIYRKQDERPVLDTDIVIVNYEHIHPHARAPGCRLKSEWETPGRFVKIVE